MGDEDGRLPSLLAIRGLTYGATECEDAGVSGVLREMEDEKGLMYRGIGRSWGSEEGMGAACRTRADLLARLVVLVEGPDALGVGLHGLQRGVDGLDAAQVAVDVRAHVRVVQLLVVHDRAVDLDVGR